MMLDELIGKSPFDQATWPDKLTAKVVQPGDTPRVYGYDVQDDLAKYYRWSELLILSLTGELPSEALIPAIDIALIFLSSVSVAEAPGHAAVLAGFCGTTNSAAQSIVTITLAEQARTFIDQYKAIPKEGVMPPSNDEGIARLRERLDEKRLQGIVLETRLGVLGAALSVLEQCGLTKSSQLEAAWVIARLPVALAEAWHQPAGNFLNYPTQLPSFAYLHPRQEEALS